MENKAISKEMTKSKTTVHDIAHTDSELYKVGMYTTAAFAAAVGLWGLVCLSSAAFANGGPVSLVKNLFQAITGM
ncbi:MAG TPA: hypothetical protein EYP35_05580 [Desulfobacterales bacterium]|nr:hypothetical protein [Desulfobacterales bacterium]HIP40673.1 hypothetical protein [Desulfocapsa sulfexigens]